MSAFAALDTTPSRTHTHKHSALHKTQGPVLRAQIISQGSTPSSNYPENLSPPRENPPEASRVKYLAKPVLLPSLIWVFVGTLS